MVGLRMARWLGTGLLLAALVPRPAAAQPFPPVADLPAQAEFPDPLRMLDGSRVQTREQWTSKRRPELADLFQHYMYGQLPPPVRVLPTIERRNPRWLDGKAMLEQVALRLGSADGPKLNVLLVVPNRRTGPAPCFVGLNFCGNHAVVDDPEIPLPAGWVYKSCAGVENERATDAGRGAQRDVWALDQSIDRGYAVALCYSGDIDPDKPDFSDGVHAHFGPTAQGPPGPQAWGTIAAWAWGLHRIVDFLVTHEQLDRRRIAVVGHSRLGKTALLAGALDERIALMIPHQAGCGGTAPSRGKVGESVERINTAFPHWFCDEFTLFNQQPEKLPFDQHCLVALCAPRPVLFSNAVEDTWANPGGQFEVLQAADPVYRLLGSGGLEAASQPEPNRLVASRLGYYIRPGKHSMTREDWKIFLDFADAQLPRP